MNSSFYELNLRTDYLRRFHAEIFCLNIAVVKLTWRPEIGVNVFTAHKVLKTFSTFKITVNDSFNFRF